jgi:zinc-ribbon domain/Protein of unknown function (DUF2628)
MYCGKCGHEVKEGAAFCHSCGDVLVTPKPVVAVTKQYDGVNATMDDLMTFVGPENPDKYRSKFALFGLGGMDSFKMSWHWPALFIGGLWALYRKMYMWFFILFAVGCIPYIGTLVWFGWPIIANYVYYKHAKTKILEIKLAYPDPAVQEQKIKEMGGVSKGMLIAGGIAVFLLVVLIMALIAHR